MPNTNFPIPAAELPLLEANLKKFPGLTLVGAVSFTSADAPYYDLFITYQQESDLYELGCCVGEDQRKQKGGTRA